MQVTLSDGKTVTLKDVYTHRMDRTFTEALYGNREDGTVTAKGLYDAYEAVLLLLIDGITPDWLGDLPKQDYAKLKKAVDDISDAGREAGKKSV